MYCFIWFIFHVFLVLLYHALAKIQIFAADRKTASKVRTTRDRDLAVRSKWIKLLGQGMANEIQRRQMQNIASWKQ